MLLKIELLSFGLKRHFVWCWPTGVESGRFKAQKSFKLCNWLWNSRKRFCGSGEFLLCESIFLLFQVTSQFDFLLGANISIEIFHSLSQRICETSPAIVIWDALKAPFRRLKNFLGILSSSTSANNNITTRKQTSWKANNFFCLISVYLVILPLWCLARSSRTHPAWRKLTLVPVFLPSLLVSISAAPPVSKSFTRRWHKQPRLCSIHSRGKWKLSSEAWN